MSQTGSAAISAPNQLLSIRRFKDWVHDYGMSVYFARRDKMNLTLVKSAVFAMDLLLHRHVSALDPNSPH